tara:strand:+ start:1117 stop:1518 length:402 start_codon:yes stop_codon:yes gene_type:complete
MKRSKTHKYSKPRVSRDLSGESTPISNMHGKRSLDAFDMLDVSEIETIITVDHTLDELYIHTDPETGEQFTNGMTNSEYIQWNAENGITLKEVRIDGEVLWYIPEEFIETPEQAKERVKLEAIHNNPDIMKRG